MTGLNRNQIKYIAIIAMLVDHIAWLFVSPLTQTWQIMHFFGRFTGPTMAVLIAEGYRHTRDVDRYTLRLALFALISWPCFSLMETGRIKPLFGVIYTLFLALMAIRLCDAECSIVLKVIGVGGLCALSLYGDWQVFDIIFALVAHLFYEKKSLRWSLHCFVSACSVAYAIWLYTSNGWPWTIAAYEFGEFLVPLVFCLFYNGEGGSRHPFHKWFFYIFYPLHMLVLWYFKYIR